MQIKNISKYQKDNPQIVLKNFSDDLLNLAKKIKLNKPDIIIVMGDRFEMLLGSISAIPFNKKFSQSINIIRSRRFARKE